ncbi:indole-3-glycerol phosphate synthase TrpC [Clostridium aminobutyricum]|uniref:Indole-3-glycerol phosphate synthase n=1 Tax=Clostridium aminobutyricum TaxID=33953 RepID=A0A939D8T9_CLOAM|nr:indole-3-glycerol phosphate synthase TrpC [Clostridium aminobutyricum]MBN7772883.1 indole-3-glycerol phosphate synthase TrpC [Clostridium aminobutyricum]
MILERIADSTRKRVEQLKESKPIKIVKAEAEAYPSDTGFPFEKALQSEGISFICEIKKASPSKGMIDEEFPYLSIAKEYEDAGASCISVLTEPKYFLGSDHYLKEVSEIVTIPILRKDFTVDPYQIYEAKILGASAVLLICALLDTDTLKEYIEIADRLGLSALVEAHTEEEVKSALAAGARIIGVNNRDLKTFEVELQTSIRLRELVPSNKIFVSESGITTAGDIALLRKNSVNAVLIGETLMRSSDKKIRLQELRGMKG